MKQDPPVQHKHARVFAEVIPVQDCDDFFAQSYTRKPRHFTQGTFMDCGFDLAGFYDILLTRLWPQGAMTVIPNSVNKGDPGATAQMLSDGGRLTLDKLRALRAAKASIRVKHVNRMHKGVRDLCFRMSRSGLYECKANVYYTPALAQGFLPHWDRHDVFILQFAGNKEWHIADAPEITAPLEVDDHHVFDGYDLGAKTTLQLTAGQALYIPRGYGHYATALDADSLHITLSVEALKWADILDELARTMPLNHEDLRHDIVTSDALARGDMAAFSNETRQMILDAVTSADLADLVDGMIKQRAHAAMVQHGEVFGSDISDLLPKD